MNIRIKNKILKQIKPTKIQKEFFEKKVNLFISELENSKQKLNFKCDFIIGGSFGKGTYLKNDFDVDIFCRFQNSKNLSLDLEKILKKAKKKILKKKGSRDYFQIKENKLKFEIIPTIKIDKIKEAHNTTEHSIYHVDFLKEKMSKDRNLVDEIRLAKQFFKAKKLYGAESYIQGFSGHIIDLLVVYYGSFKKLLEGISNWKEQTIIDINKTYKSQKEILSKIEKDKQSNLIIVDPILKTRNAARALSCENYFKAILLAQDKKNSLREKDFIIKNNTSKKEEQNTKKFAKEFDLKLIEYKISIVKDFQSQDIVGSKLLKLNTRIEKYFLDLDFIVSKKNFFISFDENICLFFFFIYPEMLPKIKTVYGPKISMKSDVKKFLINKKKYFVENDKICAYEKRKITNINDASKLNKQDFRKILGKNIDFIKKIEIIK